MTPEQLVLALHTLHGRRPTAQEILVGSFQVLQNEAHPEATITVDGRIDGRTVLSAMRLLRDLPQAEPPAPILPDDWWYENVPPSDEAPPRGSRR